MLHHLGHVSGEGGPLLLGDEGRARSWAGAAGADYARACALFDGPEPAGGEIMVDGRTAIVWEMAGAGTADVFVEENGDLLVVRAWVDDKADIEHLASLPLGDAIAIGMLEPRSAIVLLWAPEDGRTITAVPAAAGARPVGGLSMGETALVAPCRASRYRVWHDEVGTGASSARRLHLTICVDAGSHS